MTEQAIYTMNLTYTREDYDRYLSFYKTQVKKTSYKLVFYFLVSIVIGVVISAFVGNWILLGLFMILGIVMDSYLMWYQRRIDERTVEREIKHMPVTYRFMHDRLVTSNACGGEFSIHYHDLYAVYEVDWAFYIMLDRDTAAIIPKARCQDGLVRLIRGLGKVKEEWLEQGSTD